jgi:hypothetical protein
MILENDHHMLSCKKKGQQGKHTGQQGRTSSEEGSSSRPS